MFLADEWRDGRAGALKMGALHGAWCTGCCWALMAALFALGVMSVGWMVFLAAIIAVEKLGPWRRTAVHAAAIALLALGIGVALVPRRVPGLTLPNSAAAQRAMQSMHMAMPGHHPMAGKSMQPMQSMHTAMPGQHDRSMAGKSMQSMQSIHTAMPGHHDQSMAGKSMQSMQSMHTAMPGQHDHPMAGK
jgi:hypothetical protein